MKANDISIKPFESFPTDFTCADFSSLIDRISMGFEIITGYGFEAREFTIFRDESVANDIDNANFEGKILIKEVVMEVCNACGDGPCFRKDPNDNSDISVKCGKPSSPVWREVVDEYGSIFLEELLSKSETIEREISYTIDIMCGEPPKEEEEVVTIKPK